MEDTNESGQFSLDFEAERDQESCNLSTDSLKGKTTRISPFDNINNLYKNENANLGYDFMPDLQLKHYTYRSKATQVNLDKEQLSIQGSQNYISTVPMIFEDEITCCDKKVLIVDDSEFNIFPVKYMIQQHYKI